MDLYDGTPARTDMIQRQMPTVPRRVIQKWADELGKVTPRARWTKEQEAFLRKNLRKMRMKDLEKVLHRGRLSILRKAQELGLYNEDTGDGYSIDSLALALGITNDKKIKGWVDKGWLKGAKRKRAFNFDTWHFTDKNVRDFIIAHPGEIDPHRVDWLWVVDILAGKNGLGDIGKQFKGEDDE
jgi:hypothetical protein